ncbi:hypothetical protein GCM10027085_55950 [Spirosoma aerophilum]
MADGQRKCFEAVAVDRVGIVYAGNVGGFYSGFYPGIKNRRVLVNTGGRLLGMIGDKQGHV